MSKSLLVILGGVLLGCSTEAAEFGTPELVESLDTVSPEVRAALTAEAARLYREKLPDEISPESSAGYVCVANCAAGYAALCAYVGSVCPPATVVTLGGATVPCSVAIAATCIGGAALSAVCQKSCPP